MTFASKLLSRAQKMVANNERNTKHLEQELVDLETQISAKRQELQTARLSSQRLNSYTPEFDGALQCPRCWIDHERRSRLEFSSRAGFDIVSCPVCDFRFEAPFSH